MTSLESDYQRQLDQAIQAVGLGAPFIFAIIGALFGVVALLKGAGCSASFCWPWLAACSTWRRRTRRLLGIRLASRLEQSGRARYASFGPASRTVDLRRAWASADAEADTVADVLESIHSDQHLLRRPEEARAVLS